MPIAEAVADSCNVCFNPYDVTQRRPRVLPCGHSYCSLCIRDHLLEKKIICPICRKEHYADDYTDIPPNYDLEKRLPRTASSVIDKSQTATAPLKQLEVINSFLVSARDDLCKRIEKTKTDIKETRSQLEEYRIEIHLLKEKHQTQMEHHQICAQEHQMIISYLSKEDKNLDDDTERADNVLQEMSTSVDDLNQANTSEKLLMSMKNSGDRYDIAREWNSNVQKTYPNNQLFIKSHVLREESRIVSGELKSEKLESSSAENFGASCVDEMIADGEKEEADVEGHFMNIKEKIKSLLNNLESLQKNQITQTDESSISKDFQRDQILNILEARSPSEKLFESNKVFALQQNGGETRYAKISFNQSRDTCVHALRKYSSPPSDAIILQYEDVVGDDVRPGLTFLDLAAEGRPLGRIYIRLIPGGNYPLNFHRLCTGETGPSYIDSGVCMVTTQSIRFGDYETNYGNGGKAVVPGVNWIEEWNKNDIYGSQKWEKGSLAPNFLDENKVSQFLICINDLEDQTLKCRFGEVEEGFDILMEAISCYHNDDIKRKVIIEDCGIILPRS